MFKKKSGRAKREEVFNNFAREGCVMDVEEFLAQKSTLVEKKIEEIVPRDSEPDEVYKLIWNLIDRGGKRLRPALCLLSCKAVGGREEDALGAAAAIEMFHNFTLIHDDIEDCSLLRRGKPCLHMQYGVPLALNAGDGLFMMVWKAAMDVGENFEENKIAQRMLLEAFTKVLEGQAIELGWYYKNKWDVDGEEYMKMVGGKTGALIGASCAVGGFLGGASKSESESLMEFGMEVGIAFQIQDDVLNIVGDEKKYKKEIGGDVVEGKRTLIVIEALKRLPREEGEKLEDLLGKKKKSEKDVADVICLLKKSGGVRAAQKKAVRLVESARKKLGFVRDKSAREMYEKIADYLVMREV